MNEESRPDPDELLSRLTEQTETEKRAPGGALKIFFGACAGVGKTYAMLSAAKSRLKEGMDVVIGVVETHGREETVQLAQGIPVIPPREISYRGTTLTEFDIDAALLRKPQLILLDELAHTNAPGSRHPKRWQDVAEMLEAGIDVYTTLNVQHLESLNDVVARITGIWVRETVPDAFFDKAEEISLVDIPSEELLKRLQEGKVYIAPGAKRRAAQNFFKKSNLIALRELALRRTAERVDAQMDDYKVKGTQAAWSGADRILVCVGPEALSSRLVRVAKRTAGGLKAPWTAVYIENDRHYRLSAEGQEAVERTLRLAERMGGRTKILQGARAVDEIVQYARQNGFTKIIVGKAKRARWKDIFYGTLADHIIRKSGDIDVYVVTGDPEGDKKPKRAPFWKSNAPLQHYAFGLVIALVISLSLLPLRPYVQPVNLAMPYLIGIVATAVRFGRGPALVATLFSALVFNFAFIHPYYSLKISDEQHIISFTTLLITGIIIGAQTARLRLQAIHARRREENTSALYEMTRELSANRGKQNLGEIIASHTADVMESSVTMWMVTPRGELAKLVTRGTAEGYDAVREESAAHWAFSHKAPAGLGTETLPSAAGLYVPLISSGDAIGVIGVIPTEPGKSFPGDRVDLLETFANLTASALDRALTGELVERTLIETEGEKLRNILLSSVSHDLRTPLASITGAASTLLLEGQKITDEYRDELLRLIHEEAARLARMVTNLLDVSSLESGSVKLNRELYFIEELIGSALMRTEHKLGSRKIVTHIEQGLPLVRMDGLLIEQVLINLLENVAEHTPEGTEVSITVKLVKPNIHIILQDNGPGIKPGDEERIFDKFYSVDRTTPGAAVTKGGMGLAICRGIVAAHEGRIWAQNAPQGGTVVTFTLPVKGQEGV